MNRLLIAFLSLAVVLSAVPGGYAGFDYAHRYHKRQGSAFALKNRQDRYVGKAKRSACRVPPASGSTSSSTSLVLTSSAVLSTFSVPATPSIQSQVIVSTSSAEPDVASSTFAVQTAIFSSIAFTSSSLETTVVSIPPATSITPSSIIISFATSIVPSPTTTVIIIESTSTHLTTSTPVSSSTAAASGSTGTSQSDIDQYLNDQNSVRAQHGAVPLTWNNTLAAAAQDWANGCVFQHSGGKLGPYGENLAAGTGSSYGINAAMSSWTDEESQYDPNNPQASHYTQVVWKATTQVGCAMQECNGIFPPEYGTAQYYVCEYYPQGNVIGEFSENVQ